MTKKEQRRIINELCKAQREHMLDRLSRVPENWNGLELRAWFADAALLFADRPMFDRARHRSYLSDVASHNL